MTGPVDPIGDVRSLPGGQFIAACIGAVEQASYTLRQREDSAVARGQGAIKQNLREAALLAAAAEVLAAIKRDGEAASNAGRQPSALIVRAVTAGKQAFQQIDRGLPTEEAA